MTLFRQLALTIVVLFLMVFSVTLLVNLHNSRTFVQEQLASHAQDTATSLGLSITSNLQADDLPAMESMVNAIFDRGYYRSIHVTRMDGTPVISRDLEVHIEGVPGWFITALPLQTPVAEALVMSGWNQVGIVSVQSHPGYAYMVLWDTARQLFFWYTALALAAALVGWLVLRLLFRPLLEVERQAEAICARNYDLRIPLPRTRELRRVVVAMNNMTEKVKALFEEQAEAAGRLRAQAYSDPVTGCGNRRYFSAQAQTRLESAEEGGGAAFIAQLERVQELNQSHGFAAGDELLQAAARRLAGLIEAHPRALLARLSGAAFGMLVPGMERDEAEAFAASVCTALAELHGQGLTDSADVCHVGAALYHQDAEYSTLMGEADRALSIAQSGAANDWHCTGGVAPPGEAIHGGQEWREFLETVIAEQRLVLHAQPVMDSRAPERLLHREILVRIAGTDGGLKSAGVFMPMAERLGLAPAIDRVIVEQTLRLLTPASVLAVNLSPASVADAGFMAWLERQLAESAPRGRLVFELPEYGAVRTLDHLRPLAVRLQALGHGLGLDHFGRGFGNFGYLRSLRPEYVKVDSAYTRRVEQSQDDQFFVSTLCGVAHSLDILTIAEAVETELQQEVLRGLNVDGIQGYVVGRPGPL